VKTLAIGLVITVSAFAATMALADDLYNEMNMKPLTPEQSAKLRTERDAAKAQWAKMSTSQKDAIKKAARGKRLGELNAIELVGQNDDMTDMTKAETAQQKAEREGAKAKWAAMTPDQKAAVRKGAQQKKTADLNAMERVGQDDDMGRYFSY